MNAFPDLDLSLDARPPAQPGDVIDGKYRVTRVLGAGGMGVVVEATHLQLDRPIAIKFMSPLLAGDTMGVRRFTQEARAAARIQSEHVVRVFDIATLPDQAPYIVMEYLQGCDLEHLLQRRKQLPLEEAVRYILEACEAIAEAHVAGIIHRDLKPGNLFLSARADGSSLVKVLDFGVSKLLPTASGVRREGVMTGPHVIMGSPLYSSPEQLLAVSSVDARSDIWSLGTILYEMIAGTPPFVADTFLQACAKITHTPHRSLRKYVPGLPAGIDAVMESALAKDPDRRFQSVAELARELAPFAPRDHASLVERIVNVDRRGAHGHGSSKTLLSSGSPRPRESSSSEPPPLARDRQGLWWVAGAAVVTLGVAGACLAWRSEPPVHTSSVTLPALAAPVAPTQAVATPAVARRPSVPTATAATVETAPDVPAPSAAAPAASITEPREAARPLPTPAVRRETAPARPAANTYGFGGLQ